MWRHAWEARRPMAAKRAQLLPTGWRECAQRARGGRERAWAGLQGRAQNMPCLEEIGQQRAMRLSAVPNKADELCGEPSRQFEDAHLGARNGSMGVSIFGVVCFAGCHAAAKHAPESGGLLHDVRQLRVVALLV